MAKSEKEEVYKLQRALMSTETNPAVLAYNKDRSQEFHLVMDEESKNSIFGGEYKVYCLCLIEFDHGRLLVGDRVENQNW